MKIAVHDGEAIIGYVDADDCDIDTWGGARVADVDNECKIGKVIAGKYKGYTIATDGDETYAYDY